MLAQLVEHMLDVHGVRDSSSLQPTTSFIFIKGLAVCCLVVSVGHFLKLGVLHEIQIEGSV